MTFLQKAGYIRDYYWIPICLTIVLIGAGVFFWIDAGREKKETAVHIIMVESDMKEAKQQEIVAALMDVLELDPETQEVVLETELSGKENLSASATVGAYFLSGRCDVIICSEEKFNAYAVAGYFKPWEAERVKLEKDRHFYAVKRKYEGGAVTEIVNDPHDDQAEGAELYGIYLEENWVIGVLENAPNPETAEKVMEHLIEFNNLLN